MSFTGNLNLDKIDQGLLDIVTPINSFVDKINAHFNASDKGILGLGHVDKSISLRPFASEKLSLGTTLMSLLDGVGLKLALYNDELFAGVIRWTGDDLQVYTGSEWKSLIPADVPGTGTAGFLTQWLTALSLKDADYATVVNPVDEGTGNRVVYTVPTGKKAMLQGMYWWDRTVNNVVWIVPDGDSAADANKIHGNGPVSAAYSHRVQLLMSEGDYIEITSAASIVFLCSLLEFDDDSQFSQIKPLYKGNISTGSPDVLYTCPAGKQASVHPNYSPHRVGGGWFFGNHMMVTNTSGNGAVLDLYINDGSDKQIQNQSIQAPDTFPTLIFPAPQLLALQEGHSLRVKAGASGWNLWGTLVEWP